MATPKEHIQQIRKNTFSIGGPTNPLAPMLDKAVMYLSTELYQKDVHFLMELIQNAEDNEYLKGVDPSLEFVITSSDITKTGAPATLLLFNNEKGFSAKNIESICNVGNSTKKGQRKQGYIGEKGIGFKSVFLVTSQPYIFSNGYQIRFNEKPCPHCNLGYVVPEWVEDSPSLSDIRQIYGSASSLPTTTLVLPLKPDKVKPVMDQLSSIHPEVLLFLSKIKRLSVRKNDADPQLNTVSSVAISKEINFVTRKNIDAESYTLFLSAEETSGDAEKECSYYLWKQKFPVWKENQTERRKEVEEWVITLAFPFGNRLSRGMNSPGVYAFLPTEMVTNFPFIIQADFVLASSRETILLDEKWNQGILDCVPIAFVNALASLVKTTEDAPLSSAIDMFRFLPVNTSPYPKLDVVRDSIKVKLAEENIVPSESDTKQKFFHRPREVGRLMPAFWNVVKKAKDEGVSLNNLSSYGCYVLSSFFDRAKYNDTLKFLGVGYVNNEWYAKFIEGSNLVTTEVSEGTYLELLTFLADNWCSMFNKTKMNSIPLLKYVSVDGSASLFSLIDSAGQLKLCVSRESRLVSWLIDWNREFRCVAKHFFFPKSTQDAVNLCPRKEFLLKWLADQGKVTSFNANDYAVAVCNHLSGDWKLVIAYTHFLYHSSSRSYLLATDVQKLCSIMPLVDNYGIVTKAWNGILVPAAGSKWVELIGSNPWRNEKYVELNEVYSRSDSFAGETATGKQLICFLESHLGAADVLQIAPPNARIPSVSSPLTKQNAFLLLDWIRRLRDRRIILPEKFLTCIREGGWLRVNMNGVAGWKAPSQSFLLTGERDGSNWLNVLQHGSVLVDVPLIDESFYGHRINEYKDELKAIGVKFGQGEACKFIGMHLMSLAASSTLTKRTVISMLSFMKLLREKFLPLDEFILSIKGGKWLKTSCGNRSPSESVLYDEEWKTASLISNIPYLDQGYYGCEILSFKKELQLLGVQVGWARNYKLVVDYLKSYSCLAQLTAEALLLLLDCMNSGCGSEKIIQSLKWTSCLKTDVGYKAPGDCFLFDPEWGIVLRVFGGFPLVDNEFYGCGILKHRQLLKRLGVKVDFDEAINVFTQVFVQKAKSSSMTKENVLSFLSCCRQLKSHFKEKIVTSIREAKWLRTRLGDYRSPKDCILFGRSWDSIAPITLLPFIDDSERYYGKCIHEFREELKSMGVVVEFKAGVKFLHSCIRFPQNLCNLTPANVLSLLECIKILSQKKDYFFSPEVASRAWLKTHSGYCTPASCCLFDSTWASHVKHTDGPFIDEAFYGSTITSYKDELKKVGVTVDDSTKTCSLLASHLHSHADTSTIVRIYSFLKKYNWKPEKGGEARWIWVPESGKWVSSVECVLHDKDVLFGLQLNVLEKYYQPDLLIFFSSALDVKSCPSLDDYLKLWKVWESSGKKLSQAECCAFWGCVMRHRSPRTEKMLAGDLKKLPVVCASGKILLADKSDAFIADDLQLKDLFEKASLQPVFVWYPQPSSASVPRTKLMDLFMKIGVRTISESVQKEEMSLSLTQRAELKQMNRKQSLIGKGLVRLILSFLVGPALNMEAKERHEAVQSLLNLTALETVEPITVSYNLSLSSGVTVSATSTRMIRWDRESSKLFMQKMDLRGGKTSWIEYGTHFSDVIAEGVLWKNEHQIEALSEMIKVGFLLEFDDEAIQLFIKTKKLQIFMEDEDFLCAAFPSYLTFLRRFFFS